MTLRTTVVQSYFDGLGRHECRRVLGCLADDVVWDIDGHTRVAGKPAVAREIERSVFAGSPRLVVHRLDEDADVVVAKGIGEMPGRDGSGFRFAFYDVFGFDGGVISRVDSSRMPLPTGVGAAQVGRAA